MKVNIIYGVVNISDSARLAIKNELKAVGYEVVNDGIVREIKSGIDQAVSSYASSEQLVLTLSHCLEPKNPFTIYDLLRYQKEVPNVKIVFVVSDDMKGSELLKDMSDNGMYLAMYGRETSAKMIRDLIVTGRTVEDAKKYYGVNGIKNVSKQITIEGAVAHMTQPTKNSKEYIERIRWVRSALSSEDAFVACVQRLPDEIKEVLAQHKTYYPYVEDYVVSKAGGLDRSEEKSGGLLNKFKGKSAKSKEEKKAREEVAATERMEIEAAKAAEREQKEAQKKAERERKEEKRLLEIKRREEEKEAAAKATEEAKAVKLAEKEQKKAEDEKKKAEQAEAAAALAEQRRADAEEKAKLEALKKEQLRIEAERRAEKARAEKEIEVERKRIEAEARAQMREEEKAAVSAAVGTRVPKLGVLRKSPVSVGGSGREDVCVFTLRHGTGASYVSASVANYLAKFCKGDVSLVLDDVEYAEEIVIPRIKTVTWASEGDAYASANYIVHDIGVYEEMTADRRTALQRASKKILLCKGDGRFLRKLARFVETVDTSDIIFLFNELPTEWEKRVYKIIDFTKKVYCVPTFFSIAPGAPVIATYDAMLSGK